MARWLWRLSDPLGRYGSDVLDVVIASSIWSSAEHCWVDNSFGSVVNSLAGAVSNLRMWHYDTLYTVASKSQLDD